MAMTDMLAVRGLSKRYPAFVLEDVSFTLEPGRIMGLIGKNGAGKSTTLKAILRLVAPDAGEVRILGRDFRREETACKQEMGIVLGGIDFYMYKRKRTGGTAGYSIWTKARGLTSYPPGCG